MENKIFDYQLDKCWAYENGFYLTSHINRISKLLAHWEIYKKIQHLPGHVVEFGVFKGSSLIRFATYREILESKYSRKIIGFDAFGKFPNQKEILDAEFIETFEKESGQGISKEDLELALENKELKNFELIKGDILETLPKYIDKNKHLKIALLHIDVDVYKPTLCILENLYKHVVKGGIIVLDDYGTVEGETRAIDEFFADKNLLVSKLSISHIPAYIVK